MKKLLLFAFVVATTVISVAQDVKLPEFTKVLEVLNRGVNVRQQPSTSSPKIGSNAKYLMIKDEDAEWYHAVVLTNEGALPQAGYVSKKVCRVRDLAVVDADYIRKSLPDAGISKVVRQSGKYKGYSMISFDEAETYTLFIGRDCGKFYVGTAFYCIEPDEEYSFYGSNGEISIPAVRVQKSEDDMQPDWGKLSDYEIDKLMATESETSILLPGRMEIIYRGDTDSSVGEGVNVYPFDAKQYIGQ